MSIPNTITTADPIMKQASFNPSPVTFCNLPTDTLQKIQRFFPLRERATLPLVCDDFKGAKPLVSSEKAQFDKTIRASLPTTRLGMTFDAFTGTTNQNGCVSWQIPVEFAKRLYGAA